MNLIMVLSALVASLGVVNADFRQEPIYQRKTLRPGYFKACSLPRIRNGEVRLRQRGRLVVFKCRAPYILIGDRYAACVSGRWDSPTPMCIKNGCPEITIPPNAVVYPQYDNATLTLFCHTGYQRVGSARTYCDGFEWDRPLGTCKGISIEPEPACDFETDDMCGWTQDANHDFDWKRTNGMLLGKLLQIGPPYDHTLQKPLEGFYLYLDMKDGEDGDKARIVSPSYNQNKSINACFRLFYHMYGISPGTLNVYAKPLSVDIVDAIQSEAYKRFEVTGSQKNLWKEGFFSVPEFIEEFQIIIEGISTSGHSSHIAIDDVALLSGEECKAHVNDNGTKEEKGYIGTQTCINRCDEMETTLVGDLSDYTLLPNITLLKKCDCFYGCEDIDTCCSDYRVICALALTTPDEKYETDVTYSEPLMTTPSTTPAKKSISTTQTTKLISPSTTTTSRYVKVTSTVPISTSTTTQKTTEKTTTTEKPTTKPYKATTQKSESDYIADVTLIGFEDDYSDEDLSLLPIKRSQEYNFPENKPNNDLLYIIITAFIIFAAVIAGSIIYYRHKKLDPMNYKAKASKGGNEQENVEISEVQLLNADEELSFALQTPRELNS